MGENCLICCRDLPHKRNFPQEMDEPEIFGDVFQVLCQYMEWTPPTHLTFDLQRDPFPFCKACVPTLMSMYQLHGEVRKILEQIRRITLLISAKMIETLDFVPALTGQKEIKVDRPIEDITKPCNLDLMSKRFQYYRRLMRNRFIPDIRISAESKQDKIRMVKDSGGETVEICNQFNELHAFNEDFSSVGSEIEIIFTEDHQIQDDHDTSLPILDQPDAHLLPVEDTAHIAVKQIDNLIDNASVAEMESLSFNLHEDPEAGSFSEDQSHCFSRTRYGGRIAQVEQNRFAFDGKRFFVLGNNKIWRCVMCRTDFRTKTAIIGHLTYYAMGCHGECPSLAIKEHRFQHILYDEFDDGMFECRSCPTKGNSHEELQNHITQDHRKLKIKQNPTKWERIGPKELKFGGKYIVFEIEDDSGETNYQCGACDEICIYRSTMVNHCRDKHGNKHNRVVKTGPNKFVVRKEDKEVSLEFRDNKYYCEDCGYSCETYVIILDHVRREHTDMPTFVCETCGKSYRKKHLLRDHRQQYHSDRRFECDQCDKVYNQSQSLRQHIKTAHLEKDFVCEICGKGFGKLFLLKGHMKRHERVSCPICGKEYSLLCIKSHMNVHDEEHRFECKECHRKCKSSSALSTHKRVFHKSTRTPFNPRKRNRKKGPAKLKVDANLAQSD